MRTPAFVHASVELFGLCHCVYFTPGSHRASVTRRPPFAADGLLDL